VARLGSWRTPWF